MAGIFLSYRRSDAEGQAGRLYDELAGHFGQDTVFMDVAGIEAGRDFRKAIEQHVTSCGVLLALIGKDWVSAADNKGQRRLDDPNDFVRLEVATALRRDIPVVPVLVRGAAMPQPAQLPADCAELCYRNAMELTHARWNSDVEVLIKALTPHVGARSAPAPAPEVKSLAASTSDRPPLAADARPQSTGARPWLIGLPIVLAIAGGGVVAYRFNDAGGNKPQAPLQRGAAQSNAGAEKKRAEPAAPSTNLLATDKAQALLAARPAGAGGSTHPLSEWMPASQLQAHRQAQPSGERFPYDIELQCVRKGENQIRARFGVPPPGVKEIRIGHFLFKGQPQLPVVPGFREYSISQCNMPNGGRLVVRVMVQP